jgi:hypothetical protein
MKFNGKSTIIKLVAPVSFIVIGGAMRLIPHPANFVPIAAMALFGGVYLSKKQAFVLPIVAMILSDFFLGFGSLPMRLGVYGSFILTVLIGIRIKNSKNVKNVILGSLTSSILFFTITNLAVWVFSGLYLHTPQGLIQCYFFAIPFFRNTILGDLFYTGAFFSVYELAKANFFKLASRPNCEL